MTEPKFIPLPDLLDDVPYEDFMRALVTGKCPACGEPAQIDREQLKYPSSDGSRYIYAGFKVTVICQTGKHVARKFQK